jgi:antitoxin component YwqK of YwqJK toxin-antitoxin module
MRRPKSDIPAGAEENIIQQYEDKRTEQGGVVNLETRECTIDGKVVGWRSYDPEGRLVTETALKDGKKHGRAIDYYDNGRIHFVEPYFEGMMHGTAKQYDARGRIIGTYKMKHGTGYDIWRNQFGGPNYVSEIRPMRDGLPHGFEWWLNEDQLSVYEEKHWFNGKWHGIEREWNFRNKLRRGYPKYWIRGEAVTKQQYLAAARKDATLPPFRLKDNSPKREFPPEIRRLLKDSKKR